MFAVDCPTCGSRRLVTPQRIVAIQNADDGIRVYFTCVCGVVGLWISGRTASRPGVYWPSGLVVLRPSE
jgi:hypothetical protein